MSNEESVDRSDDIAIVGIAGRFPGARNVEQFWQNVRNGVESITFFTDEELLEAGTDPRLLADPNFVKAGAVLDDVDLFDAAFFGLNPREAEILDPQHRLFLELCHEALETAGFNPDTYPGLVSVYAGVGWNKYLMFNLLSNQSLVDTMGALTLGLSNEKDFFATRISYKLNLKGAAVNVQTACSSSLVSLHLACQSLLSGECDMALAGGVSIALPQKQGYLFVEGGINSSDGHCRAFDARGDGAIAGSGGGAVLLKRLEDALADGDVIHAVVKGSAINNDGSQKVGFSAPSVKGQAAAIAEAMAMAGVEPEDIDYVEAHGTATTLGDPIEITALKQVYQAGTSERGFCAIGSVKTNVGHLDAGAGITGLIKTVLALKHKEIPPSLHFENPNPQIDFENSPFFVNTELRPWLGKERSPRRAGVSSFGMGGTNVHVILEEAPEPEETDSERPHQLLVLSAKTATALETVTDNVAAYLRENTEANLADVAFTLQAGRRAFNHRRVLVARDVEEAAQLLATRDPKRILSSENDRSKRPVAFLLTGLGDHYVNMAAELYQTEPSFQATVDRCCDLLQPHLGLDLRDILYPEGAEGGNSTTQGFDLRKMLRRDTETDPHAEKMNQLSVAHPALFVIEYALAKLLMAWGIRPQAMIGHSLGEYVAATLAGVFTLESALALVTKRAQLIEKLPSGAMLAVPMPEEQLLPLLGDGLCMAAVNAPAHCVVSGTLEAVSALEQQLHAQGVSGIRVNATHAFHSPQMEPIVESFKQLVISFKPKAPKIPFLSNVTATWITEAEAVDPSYWARHLCGTVRFAEGVQELCQDENLALLEIGPGQTLSAFVAQNSADRIVLPTIRMNYDNRSDRAFLLTTLGQLWLSGVDINWEEYHAQEARNRILLPTYPFERQRYWIDPPRAGQMQMQTSSQEVMGHAMQTAQTAQSKMPMHDRDIRDALSTPVWKQTPLPQGVKHTTEPVRYLVFTDALGVGESLVDALTKQGHGVITVAAGDTFAKTGVAAFELNPRVRGDYDKLVHELLAQEQMPQTILHLWSVTEDEAEQTGSAYFADVQEIGCYSLLYLTQALEKQLVTAPLTLWALSTHLHELGGWDALVPEKTTLLGALAVIPQEVPNIRCHSLDISLPRLGTRQADVLRDQLLAEFGAPSTDRVIAYRGHQRFVQTFEPLATVETEQPSHLREKGVYLITGGLGVMGLKVAEHLARAAQAKLVLTSRFGLPSRDEWARWLADPDTDGKLRRRIESVHALEALGADVWVVQADVTDTQQMQETVEAIYKRDGTLHGVIHAAGNTDPDAVTSIAETGLAECEAHFEARVHGLYGLAEVLEDRKLDFTLLVSSIAALLGGIGFAAPSAAHAFMDAFAHSQTRRGDTPWVTVDFDQVTTAETGIVLEQVLGLNAVQLVVSKQDLQQRLQQSARLQTAGTSEMTAATGLHPRPNLHNPYVAPTNELEEVLADILQELLGIEQVGIHDNFFQLGGNSLLGTQVVSRIRLMLQVDMPLRVLFEANTVHDLALIVEDILLRELEELDEEEAQRLL